MVKIIALASQGAGSHDEDRLRALLTHFETHFFAFNPRQKRSSFFLIISEIYKTRPDLVCLEGTGIAAGGALLICHFVYGTRFLISSGDAVGPFVASKFPILGPFFNFYERLLYRRAAGFVGWTPYLTGRALTFGVRRAMTIPGWAPFKINLEEVKIARIAIRERLKIPKDAIVIGIAGSLAWNKRVEFCYGKECIEALLMSQRQDVHVVIVGDGTGREILEKMSGKLLSSQIHFTGRVSRVEIPSYLAAMDLGSLPQSVDQVGSFRYSTKLPEYVEAGLPFVTGEIPLSFDLAGGGIWRLPGDAPWNADYVNALSNLLKNITHEELRIRSFAIKNLKSQFDQQAQVKSFSEFINSLLSIKHNNFPTQT